MNYFDVEKEFFLIDSDNLQNVETKFYGYSVQEGGIYENDNLTESAIAGLGGCGTYVYVEVKNGKIIIQQDFNGSYGIYFYQQDEYFALSNSFFRLLNHIKTKVLLSLNRDYANHMLVEGLANSIAYSQTLVQEIAVADRTAVITIDIKDKTLVFDYLDYREDSISLDSTDGMAILDDWFLRWTIVLQNLGKHTNQIAAGLSGGFDSRITLFLLHQAGVDLNKISVNSVKDSLHTHKEDYEIASSIADYYGFWLNGVDSIENYAELKPGDDDGRAINYSLEDLINIEFHTKMAFHKEMFFRFCRPEAKRYVVSGAGAEAIREFYKSTASSFIKDTVKRTSKYSKEIAGEMSESITKLIHDAYTVIKEKYRVSDDDSIEYPQDIYREVRCRNHFGKWAVEDYCYNIYTLSPLLDPKLRSLKLSDEKCTDNNLLLAIIYVRYFPELLDFKFDGGRSFHPETIEHARMINQNYPGGGYTAFWHRRKQAISYNYKRYHCFQVSKRAS